MTTCKSTFYKTSSINKILYFAKSKEGLFDISVKNMEIARALNPVSSKNDSSLSKQDHVLTFADESLRILSKFFAVKRS